MTHSSRTSGLPGEAHRGLSRNGLAVVLSAVALSFLLVSLLVVTSSHAAFTATTTNVNNRARTDTIALTDNDNGSAMFDNVTTVPGTPVDRCIRVTYTGADTVKLFAPTAPSGGLPPYLTLTVDIGSDSAGLFPDCTGFSSTGTLYSDALAAMPTTHAGGLTTWTPATTGEARVFRFRLEVQDVPAAQGKDATFSFTWEARSS